MKKMEKTHSIASLSVKEKKVQREVEEDVDDIGGEGQPSRRYSIRTLAKRKIEEVKKKAHGK